MNLGDGKLAWTWLIWSADGEIAICGWVWFVLFVLGDEKAVFDAFGKSKFEKKFFWADVGMVWTGFEMYGETNVCGCIWRFLLLLVHNRQILRCTFPMLGVLHSKCTVFWHWSQIWTGDSSMSAWQDWHIGESTLVKIIRINIRVKSL